LLATHDALGAAAIPHAFGGAIALAYCTEEPRGTRDLDINAFVPAERAGEVLAALPDGVRVTDEDIAIARRDEQVRVWWDDTPLDLFFDAGEFHAHAATAVRWVPFEGHTIPILGCDELVVFKVLFNRTRDWADIEAIVSARALDCGAALGWLERLIGADDERARRLAGLCG
jgi:hypothetical protein